MAPGGSEPDGGSPVKRGGPGKVTAAHGGVLTTRRLQRGCSGESMKCAHHNVWLKRRGRGRFGAASDSEQCVGEAAKTGQFGAGHNREGVLSSRNGDFVRGREGEMRCPTNSGS